MPKYPQFIASATIRARLELEGIEPVQEVLARLRMVLGPKADINLRYSGTEDKVRLSVRGCGDHDADFLNREAAAALGQIAEAISNGSHWLGGQQG